MSVDLVFDNSPLSHFARAGRLGALAKLVAPYRCVTPAEVTNEIHVGLVEHPSLAIVLAAQWLEVVELREVDEIVAFARYKAELGGGSDKNNGEAAVLGWTAVHGGVAIIDERAGTRIAQRDGIDVHGTLWLVANGVSHRDTGSPRRRAHRRRTGCDLHDAAGRRRRVLRVGIRGGVASMTVVRLEWSCDE